MTTMTESDVQTDLNAVNDQLTTLVHELNKINAAREQLVTQIQNLNGVAMYLRGKLPADEEEENPEGATDDSTDRSVEYPS